jgi:pimeloyl-ACP methyl ester carboxylesterase
MLFHPWTLSPCVTTFVLIHGNWHDGSAWNGVIRRLEHLGHIAHAPTLPGHGPGASKNVGHDQGAESVVDYVLQRNLTDIVLVGHSGGGTTISKVVEAFPEHVRRLIYVSGFVLNDGESQADLVPPYYRELFEGLAAGSGDGTVAVPFEVFRDAFINDAAPDLARSAYEQLSPTPYRLIVEPVELKKFQSLTTPKSFILPTEDISLPRDDEWGWHPRITSRLGQHRFLEMPGSHEVVFTNPDGLADKLIEASVD